MEFFEGTSLGKYYIQSPDTDQEEEVPEKYTQRGRCGPQKSTIVHEAHLPPCKAKHLSAQEDERNEIDVQIMNLYGNWTCVPDEEDPEAPILCASIPKPSHPPTETEEAATQAYACPIVEEEPDSNDEAED